jgi:nucleoside 2-deoxyribosyltransferase
MTQLKCLVLAPLDASAHRLRDAVNRVLREHGVEVMSLAESLTPGAQWVDEIFGLLRASDFLIADVSRKNPNVLFELGVAHGLGKPFVLLLDVSADVSALPSDLMGYQYISYDPANLSPLVTRLGRVVESVVARARQER